jgi:hypothetical protein
MSRFDLLLNRLQRLESDAVDNSPWPPKEGTFAYFLWMNVGKPKERIGYWDMYMARAKQFWEDIDEPD